MWDSPRVLVIGGGPAGSTVAGLLAREGLEVTVIERERFPRYHIGESILPSSLAVLDVLGVRKKIEQHGFQVKRGVRFRWGPDDWSLAFNELGDDTAYAWQVVRSEFDEILLDHAAELGAQVRQGTTVRQLHFSGDRPTAATWVDSRDPARRGHITFDYLVDASGRGGVLVNRYLKSRRFNEYFKNVAVWRYWRDVGELTGVPEGSTGVFSVPGGWFWLIPLHDGTTSVGLVTGRDAFSERRRELGGALAVYEEALAGCTGLEGLLANAEPVSGIRLEQDYSYVADAFTGPGYLLAGDAACFLDPLLSTGVHLAMFSGMVAAGAIGSVLREEVPEAQAFGFYQRAYRRAYERMVLLVSAFYESYRGKDYHFYNAQRLSVREKQSLQLHESFLRIIAGVEDMEDAKLAAYDRAVAMLAAGPDGKSPFRYIPGMRAEPVDAENAIGGIYLTFKPRLGLAWSPARRDMRREEERTSSGESLFATGPRSEAHLPVPPDVDIGLLRQALGPHFDAFVAGGLHALARDPAGYGWVQFGLEPHVGQSRTVLADLRRLAARLLEEGAAVNFFFMRKPPGLRVRFETAPQARDSLADRIESEMAAWRPNLVGLGRGRYEPEEELFGGADSMALVHRLFTVDSQAWLAYFSLSGQRPPWLFSLVLVRQVLDGLAIQDWEDLGVWERIRSKAGRIVPSGLDQAKVAGVAAKIRALWADSGALREALGGPAAELADEHGERVRERAREWNAGYFAAGDAAIGPREGAAFATVFHWNRGAVSSLTQRLIAEALADRSARP